VIAVSPATPHLSGGGRDGFAQELRRAAWPGGEPAAGRSAVRTSLCLLQPQAHASEGALLRWQLDARGSARVELRGGIAHELREEAQRADDVALAGRVGVVEGDRFHETRPSRPRKIEWDQVLREFVRVVARDKAQRLLFQRADAAVLRGRVARKGESPVSADPAAANKSRAARAPILRSARRLISARRSAPAPWFPHQGAACHPCRPVISINSADRLLLLAPHPDDESLATGGLIQKAIAAGARVRVLFVTSGDNNPWPQRYLERRWHISASHRERWAERRRAEATAALRALGADAEAARYLGYPDQGLTGLLMAADEARLQLLRDEWRKFRPTIAIVPAVDDAHPDHSALAVMASLVLDDGANPDLRVYDFLVHRPKVLRSGSAIQVTLSDAQLQAKLAAVRCHESQIALSRGRLERLVQREEYFREVDTGTTGDAPHPIAAAALDQESLTVAIARHWHFWGDRFLFVAGQDSLGRSIRWSVKVSGQGGKTLLRDEQTSNSTACASVEPDGKQTLVRMKRGDLGPGCHIYAKLSEPTMFFDRAGWREIIRPGSASPKLANPSALFSASAA
jgi:LmbE family N-acetylglucosaminyl deacetylase